MGAEDGGAESCTQISGPTAKGPSEARHRKARRNPPGGGAAARAPSGVGSIFFINPLPPPTLLFRFRLTS